MTSVEEQKQTKKIKVLIIDDDVEYLDFLKDDFKDFQEYEPYMASTEKEGLVLATEVNPDVILLDILMPEEGGMSVLQKLKESDVTRSIPVVMLTAVRSFEARLQALRMYCEGYIEKPCTCEKIIKGISEVFKRRIEIRAKINRI